MQSDILNIENWNSYKDEVGTHYTYKIDNFVVNQYYINCITEDNNIIGYPIHYCPIYGAKLE